MEDARPRAAAIPRSKKLKKKIALILLYSCPALLVSCGGDALGPSEVQGDWRLVSLQRPDLSTTVIPDPSRFTARFAEDGSISLRADCNVCGGAYSLDDRAITSGLLACTRAYCVATAPLDSLFVGILEGRSSVRESDDRLVLSSERGTLVFVR